MGSIPSFALLAQIFNDFFVVTLGMKCEPLFNRLTGSDPIFAAASFCIDRGA